MNNKNMTNISKNQWDVMTESEMNPAEVIRYFHSGIKIRTFGDVLLTYSKSKEDLFEKLCSSEKGIQPDSIRRKMNNWILGKNVPNDREYWLSLCFTLRFDENTAISFMSFHEEGTFHLRNPRELTYLYCLRTNKSYEEAKAFYNHLRPLSKDVINEPVFVFPYAGNNKGFEANINKDKEKIIYTKVIRDAFTAIYDDASFYKFYDDSFEYLGMLHNTAYRYFMDWMSVLMLPPKESEYLEKERIYSVSEAVRIYLQMNLPLVNRHYTPLQKAIHNSWPNLTSIKNMHNRREDINRKVLLLLYIVTDGYDVTDAEITGLSPEECLENHAWRIDLILHECGFGLLDIRNPFDNLILYSLKKDDDNDEGMSERLQSVLNLMFPA